MIIILSILSALVFLMLLALTLLVTHTIWNWPDLGRVRPSASSFTMVKEALDYLGLKSDYVYLNDEKSEVRFYVTYNEIPFTVDALLRPGSRAVCLAHPAGVDIPVSFAQDAMMVCNNLNRYKGLRYRAILTTKEGPLSQTIEQRPLTIALIATHEMGDQRVRKRAEMLLEMLREGYRCSESLLSETSQALDAAEKRKQQAEISQEDQELEQEHELHEDMMRMQAIMEFLDPQHTLS